MYKLQRFGGVLRKSDGAFIPEDRANMDYQKFLEDQAAGVLVEPADGPTLAEINAPTLAEIEALERSTFRALREHILGDAGAAARLKAIDDKIVAARGKLKK